MENNTSLVTLQRVLGVGGVGTPAKWSRLNEMVNQYYTRSIDAPYVTREQRANEAKAILDLLRVHFGLTPLAAAPLAADAAAADHEAHGGGKSRKSKHKTRKGGKRKPSRTRRRR